MSGSYLRSIIWTEFPKLDHSFTRKKIMAISPPHDIKYCCHNVIRQIVWTKLKKNERLSLNSLFLIQKLLFHSQLTNLFITCHRFLNIWLCQVSAHPMEHGTWHECDFHTYLVIIIHICHIMHTYLVHYHAYADILHVWIIFIHVRNIIVYLWCIMPTYLGYHY